ncbi:mitochondrial 37S ribosomal protein uS17m Ecym_2140 [Eremothecium cymbalariae DBVPG|uniref:Uncharacterized protein n=1 Tax=Eremothecium cymbalariae (strain CBS 270.75 / DBVPG 7215 / KCTC 17166 / NRRL Y-17582) TaxID=931890 RepID=G8JNH6_ERECY|nr:Hypothetical protein Ecym_2140 [Eremothecium cymbalariae DBVPG\
MARQNFVGLVVSQGKMQKTVKVRVENKVFNKRINKEMFNRKDYLVHDEGEVSREGDLVRIEATRPLSKRKFFSIAEIIRNKGQQFAVFQSQAKVSVASEEAEKTKEFLDRRAAKQEEDSVLLQDVLKLQAAYVNSGTDSAEIEEIKKRHGIGELTADSVRQLLQLDIESVHAKIMADRACIDSITSRVSDLLQDDAVSNEFLSSRGVENPSSLKKNIKKNLLRKHLMKEQGIL